MRTLTLFLLLAAVTATAADTPDQKVAAGKPGIDMITVATSPTNLTVYVPVGATLTFNGARTEQMTAVRTFVTPAVEMGKDYYYTVEATYTSNGEPVLRRHQLKFTAGQTLVINMLEAEQVVIEKPKPKAEKTPFDTPKSSNPFESPKKPK